MSVLKLREACADDASRLLEIYAPYIEHTAITFEYEVPSVEEFKQRIVNTLTMYPYIVALQNDRIVGYAYASAFHVRSAYAYNVEMSIYVDINERHKHIGRFLYEALEGCLRKQGFLNVNACIAAPREKDPYLDDNSIRFHEHLGYQLVGRFHECGYKFGRWYDMVWMEKMLGEHPEHPAALIPFKELKHPFE